MLKMAGSRAEQTKIKTPRGQAWPAETQTSGAANANLVDRQRMREPARQRGPSHRHAQTESGNQMATTMTVLMRAETSTSVR